MGAYKKVYAITNYITDFYSNIYKILLNKSKKDELLKDLTELQNVIVLSIIKKLQNVIHVVPRIIKMHLPIKMYL